MSNSVDSVTLEDSNVNRWPHLLRRVALIGIVYVLLFVYLIVVVRHPQQTVYDQLTGTAVVSATEPAE